jgi:hypothetical protein
MRKIKLDKKQLALDTRAIRKLTADMLVDVNGGNYNTRSCPDTATC